MGTLKPQVGLLLDLHNYFKHTEFILNTEMFAIVNKKSLHVDSLLHIYNYI